MDIQPTNISQTSMDTRCYKLQIAPGEQQFFCYMLESIDNLAMHSKAESAGLLSVYVPVDLSGDFEEFLSIYNDFKRINSF